MKGEKEQSPKVQLSIILPVYNTKDDLPRCIESVLKQTYPHMEIIIVDDGSTDGSDKICDAYKRLDSRIRVIHKENGGNTSARKAGVKAAGGDYIGFVDSDDWIEPEMYEILLRYANECDADVVCSGYYTENGVSTSKIPDGVQAGIYSKKENYGDLIRNLLYVSGSENRGVSMSLCNKIVRKDIAEQVVLNLNDEIQILEDAICVYKAILKADVVCLLNQGFYHYCMRENSILHSKDANYFIKINLAYKELRKEFQMYPEYTNALMNQLGKLMIDYLVKGINYFFDFGVNVSIPYYLCPMESMRSGARIVLYGAGKLGISYYEQMKRNHNCQLVAWVDKDYLSKRERGLDVQPLESLSGMEYDYILLGAQKAGMADSMRKTLQELGVENEKIVWKEPRSIAFVGEELRDS